MLLNRTLSFHFNANVSLPRCQKRDEKNLRVDVNGDEVSKLIFLNQYFILTKTYIESCNKTRCFYKM